MNMHRMLIPGMACRFTDISVKPIHCISALFEISVIGIGKSQDRYNIGYRLSVLAKYRLLISAIYWQNSEPIKYWLSVIGFGQISAICYRLNLTDMPSLVNTQSWLKVCIHTFWDYSFKNKFPFWNDRYPEMSGLHLNMTTLHQCLPKVHVNQ